MANNMSIEKTPIVAASQSIDKLASECVRSHPRLYSVFDVLDFDSECRTLIVRGVVPTFHLKQLLQESLRELPGVDRVDNQVDVASRTLGFREAR